MKYIYPYTKKIVQSNLTKKPTGNIDNIYIYIYLRRFSEAFRSQKHNFVFFNLNQFKEEDNFRGNFGICIINIFTMNCNILNDVYVSY